MKIKKGSRVRIIQVIKCRDARYNSNKETCVGMEGTILNNPFAFRDSINYPELPQGKKFYTVVDDNNKPISPYGWFAKELELI